MQPLVQQNRSLDFYSFFFFPSSVGRGKGIEMISVISWDLYFWNMSQIYLGKRNEIQQYGCANRANVLLMVALSSFVLALSLFWYSWNAFKYFISSLERAEMVPCVKVSFGKKALILLRQQSYDCLDTFHHPLWHLSWFLFLCLSPSHFLWLGSLFLSAETFGGQAIPWLPADETRSVFSVELCNSCPLSLQSQFWESVISFVNPYVPGRIHWIKFLNIYPRIEVTNGTLSFH